MTFFKFKFARMGKSRLFRIIICCSLFAIGAHARVGDSKETANRRYRKNIEKYVKTSNGFETASYKVGDFNLQHYFLNGKCVRLTYLKCAPLGEERQILMDELKEILISEKGYGKWEMEQRSVGISMFKLQTTKLKNTNGTMLEIKSGNQIIDLTTPDYQHHLDYLARKKQAQRKSSIRKF